MEIGARPYNRGVSNAVGTSRGRAAIEVLPAHVVNQIAAGEVVERPASVVKELLDNALDARAMRITVEIEKGGIELIRVTDDGGGIPAAELALAVHPHATSKIRSADDLDAVATMGFRGEAVASIASVSRMTIRSRTRDEEGATIVSVDGGEMVGGAGGRPEAGSVGTAVTVRNLFFNTPARRKFLRTAQTEKNHCVDVARDLALAHPAIGWRMVADGKEVFDAPAGQLPKERARAILGKDIEAGYFEVHADEFDDARGLALWGLIGHPSLASPAARRQHVFINGRPIRDKTIQHALREAYRGLTEPGRHPAAVLLIEMDPRAVDVNVHPAKSEVRFRDSQVVHRVVYRAVRDALQQQDLSGEGVQQQSGIRFQATHAVGYEAGGGGSEGRVSRKFVDFVGQLQKAKEAGGDEAGRGFEIDKVREAIEREKEQLREEARRLDAERVRVELTRAESLATDHLRASTQRDAERQSVMGAVTPGARLLQVHNSFLVTQDEQGVVIIDQHALHERVMFETLRKRIESGNLESQRLLVPDVIDATPKQIEILDDLQELLEKLGISAAAGGPATIAVHGFPSLLFERGVEAGVFVGELLARTEEEGLGGSRHATDAVSSEAALHEVVDMMACKAAVKAGDKLSDEEIARLIEMRGEVERSSNCPHGRPTSIRLTIKELEKQFGR